MNSYTIQYGDTLSGIASKTGKSIQELMRLNPSITDPNKIYAGRTLSLGTSAPAAPAPAPKPTIPQKQTIAQVAKVTVPNYVEDSTSKQIGLTYKSQATERVNEEAIRAATRARIQGQIDAINAAVADQIANFRNTTAKNRQGQSYALAAAGGRIGSATGEAEFQKTEDYNNQEEQTYRSEANLRISQLFGQATRDADTEIKNKREAIQQGIDKYFEFLDNQGKRKRDQVSAFIKNMLALGVDPTSLSDADFEKLQDQYGFTKEQLSTFYNDAKTERDQATLKAEKEKVDLDKAKNDANQFDLSEGQARYVYDPVTGKTTIIASKAKTYAPTGGSGTASDPVVDSWVSQINAGKATIANVPANLKNAVITALTSSTPAGDSNYQINNLKSALENVQKLKGAAGPSAISRKLGDTFIGNSSFRQLEAYVDTVKTNLLTLVTDPNIKKFFGPQMSNRDVELMTSTASSLDAQRLNPEQIQAEIDKINAFLQKYEAAQNSSGFVDTTGTVSEEQSALRTKYQY
jgi:murein DD-endopeptidase MepM/ murein hydrolase activator NlpD